MATEIDALPTSKSLGWTDALISRLAANSFGLGGRLSITAPANASALSSTGYSLTGSNASSMVDLAGTWNTTGTPTAIKLNVTNLASNAASLLMDLKVGGASMFRVDRNGLVTSPYLQTTSYIASPGIFSQSNSGGIYLGAANDIVLRWDAANTLALRNAANAQAFNIYNTYTSGSVYERGFIRWVSNVLEIGTEHVGATLRKTRIISGAAGTNSFEFDGETFRFLYNGSVSASMTPYSHIFGTAGGQSNGFTLGSSTRNVMTITSFDVTNIRVNLGGDTSSFPALKRSSTVLQSRLADDSDFAPLQGRLRSHANATSETVTPTHTLRLFDAAGTEYRVPAIAV